MIDQEKLDALIQKHGYQYYKWIQPETIIVAQWVRMKCTFGCPDYGNNACCPPNTPSVSECRQFFNEYKSGLVFHFEKAVDKPEDLKPWSLKVNNELFRLEREIFLSGYPKTFLLFMAPCRLCKDCKGSRSECKNPKLARPTPEGMGVDVFSTVKQYGFPIQVLADYSETMNRYAFLLIE